MVSVARAGGRECGHGASMEMWSGRPPACLRSPSVDQDNFALAFFEAKAEAQPKQGNQFALTSLVLDVLSICK